ncbi:MAG TPA: hypothetical protein VEP66_18125 [Myxococcales bacterium]|nr:hypothetical protein [Myxococcales bacterium]
MQIERADLDEAAARQIVDAAQAAALWRFLGERHPARARFTGLNVAYFFGALVVIAAMGWLMTLGFERLGPWAVFVIATCYAALFAAAGEKLRVSEDLKVPGGLLYTMAVCMTPLAIWGLEKGTGFWPDHDPGNYRDFFPYVRSSWIWMEAGTVLAALLALRRVRFPFLVAPAAVSLWFMSMDLVAYLSRQKHWELGLGQRVSIVFGLAMLFVAYLTDHRTREDFAFWLYLFGLTALWGALSSMDSGSEWRRFLYCLLNLGFIALSVLLRRRVFLVYGAIGVNAYLVRLAYTVFKDSMLFPFALTALGLAVIALAVKYQRNRQAIDARIESWIPDFIRELLPRTRFSAQYL